MNRRRFLAIAGGCCALALPGCALLGKRRGAGGGRAGRFPLLRASGTAREVGLAIGRRFRRQIRLGIERRREWFEGLRSFMRDDPANRYRPFVEAGCEFFPDAAEELKGAAEGAGLNFEDLMVLVLKAELAAMRAERPASPPGCSTLALAHGNELLLAHNEDGHSSNADLMFFVEASVRGKPAFTRLTYPGIISGSGPSMNEAGVVMTTNFIAGTEVRPGIPRYFISRAARHATCIEEAVKVVTRPQRAFSFSYNFASTRERRMVIVETSPDRHAMLEVEGLQVHTNHFVLEGMKDISQESEYVQSSSLTRYRILRARCRELEDRLDLVDGDALRKLLSLHEGAPYSPCRHPRGDVEGITLACSVFDIAAGSWLVTVGPPCSSIPYRVA